MDLNYLSDGSTVKAGYFLSRIDPDDALAVAKAIVQKLDPPPLSTQEKILQALERVEKKLS